MSMNPNPMLGCQRYAADVWASVSSLSTINMIRGIGDITRSTEDVVTVLSIYRPETTVAEIAQARDGEE